MRLPSSQAARPLIERSRTTIARLVRVARGGSWDKHPFAELLALHSAFDTEGHVPDVLYFGDSVVERLSHHDDDRRTLGQMVADELRGSKQTFALSHSAYHSQVFHGFIRCLARTRGRPGLILLPVNMRSFSPQWDLEPTYQFISELEALEAYAAGRLTVLEARDWQPSPQQYEAYDHTPVSFELSSLDRIGQFRLVVGAAPKTKEQARFRHREIFVFHYGAQLERSHRKLLALADCLRAAAELGMRVLVYATPINYEAATEFAGQGLGRTLASNVATVAEAIEPWLGTTAKFLDLSSAAPREQFFHAYTHTEHLNQTGRLRLATTLRGAVERW